MAKDLPSFIAQEGAKREGSVIREKNFIDANNYETVAYLKHLDVRNEPKMVLFENVPALNGKKSEFPMFYNPWVTRQYVADSLDMGDIKSPMEVSLEVAKLEQQDTSRVLALQRFPLGSHRAGLLAIRAGRVSACAVHRGLPDRVQRCEWRVESG